MKNLPQWNMIIWKKLIPKEEDFLSKFPYSRDFYIYTVVYTVYYILFCQCNRISWKELKSHFNLSIRTLNNVRKWYQSVCSLATLVYLCCGYNLSKQETANKQSLLDTSQNVTDGHVDRQTTWIQFAGCITRVVIRQRSSPERSDRRRKQSLNSKV